MNIFGILSSIYTKKESDWILDLQDKEIQPYVIQRWLCMNERVKKETRYLDKFVFSLKPKEYLSLAWSVIPKQQKAPFVKYIKKKKETDNLDFIIPKVKEYFDMADNDWKCNEKRIRDMINKDMASWLRFFGIRKYYWKKFGIDFNKIK